MSPPVGVIPLLLSPLGISKSKIISPEPSSIQRRSLSMCAFLNLILFRASSVVNLTFTSAIIFILGQISVAASIAPCDESTLLDLDSDLPSAMSAAVSVPLLERWVEDGAASPAESQQSRDIALPKVTAARLQLLDAADPAEPDLQLLSEQDSLRTSTGGK